MNLYYDDNALGLEKVGEFDISEPDYSFDIFAVWRDPITGDFYTATDSGCSCPSPFEDISSRDDLTRHNNAHAVLAAIRAIENPDGDPSDLIAKVMAY